MQMTARGPDFSEFARRIAEGFCGMGLKDADDRLADARHVLWGNHFTGFPMAEVAFGAGVSQEALTLADAIATEGKGNLHAMEEILFEVRAVLFVTACSTEREMDRALAAGVSDYILKPFHPGELTMRANLALVRRAAAVTPALVRTSAGKLGVAA